jgi:hypothetical protein
MNTNDDDDGEYRTDLVQRNDKRRTAGPQHVQTLDCLRLQAMYDVHNQNLTRCDTDTAQHQGAMVSLRVQRGNRQPSKRTAMSHNDDPRSRRFVNVSWPGVSMTSRPGTRYSSATSWRRTQPHTPGRQVCSRRRHV